MIEFEVAVIGAGPAGLSAANIASRHGAKVVLIDENDKPGGQLFKQIHKFFGSKTHYAAVRGIDIGAQLLAEAKGLGVRVLLNTTVWGVFDKRIAVHRNAVTGTIRAEQIIIATGGQEKPLRFPGWTLPGVMTAGAAQTLMNLHRVLPGHRVLMVGSGNIGLIVSYQLLQAGVQVVSVIEADRTIGGYFVHAAKISRAGVPILVSHTIKEAYGKEEVEGAVIVAVDEEWNPVSGSEKKLKVDNVLLSVGLSSQVELAWMAGCKMTYSPLLGGYVPLHNCNMETSVRGIYVAGDAAGIGEASTAMEEGRIAGISAIESLDKITSSEASVLKAESRERLSEIRSGSFGENLKIEKEKITRMAV